MVGFMYGGGEARWVKATIKFTKIKVVKYWLLITLGYYLK